MSSEQATLRERIHTVSEVSADEDRLLTLTVAADDSVGAIQEQIEEKRAELEYLITGETDEYRLDTFERALRILRDYEETPENGLVVYVGVINNEVMDYIFDDLSDPTAETGYTFANTFDIEPLTAPSPPAERMTSWLSNKAWRCWAGFRRGASLGGRGRQAGPRSPREMM